MTAGKNYNIQTKSISVGSSLGISRTVGSAVPAGMTRYVTFIAISPRTGSASCGRRVYFCSAPGLANTISTTALASTAAKLRYTQASNVTGTEPNVHFPKKINTEAPLFTIAASKYMHVFQNDVTSGSGPTSIFVQYYEQ